MPVDPFVAARRRATARVAPGDRHRGDEPATRRERRDATTRAWRGSGTFAAVPRRARVVVTTYERLPLLRLALRAWRRQTCLDFALTVADDGSGPETGAFVREFAASAPFPVRHVWWKNQGF